MIEEIPNTVWCAKDLSDDELRQMAHAEAKYSAIFAFFKPCEIEGLLEWN